ncbi:MAG: sigma-70 family RNA polymerase sigma factor [Candidatus Omnitrophota bacterium]
MDDLDFIQRCALGDKAAWSEFVERYSQLIYSSIHNALKARGAVPAPDVNPQDILQEIFLSLVKDDFRKLRTFQGRNGCSLASWLRQVALNACIDRLRKAHPVYPMEDSSKEEYREVSGNAVADAAGSVQESERADHLKSCIDRLGLDDKYFIELYVGRGLRLVHLQKLLRSSRGAVDMRKARVVRKLRDCFRSKGYIFASD